MAWLQKHVGADGVVRWHLTTKNPKAGQRGQPKTLTRRLGPISEERARAEAEVARVADEGRAPRTDTVEAAAALQLFLAHWRSVRRRSEKTLLYYEQKLGRLFDFLARRAPIQRWHAGLVSDYIVSKGPNPTATTEYARRGLSPLSIQMLLIAAGTFVKWARKARLNVPDFVAGVDRPTVRRKPRKHYEPGEVLALFREADEERTHRWLRLSIYLAAEAGLSLGDIRAVVYEELDWKDDLIRRARSKTGILMEIPITPRLKALLKAGRATHGPIVRDMPKDDSSASKAFRRLCGRAGVDAAGGLKRLRHTWATRLGLRGAEFATVAELLGHAPNSVQAKVYMHTSLERKRAAVARLDWAEEKSAPKQQAKGKKTG